jgi:hypothetical protein
VSDPSPPPTYTSPTAYVAALVAGVGTMLAMGSIVYSAGFQQSRISENARRIAALESTVTSDHDRITRIETGVQYLVDRAQSHDRSTPLSKLTQRGSDGGL